MSIPALELAITQKLWDSAWQRMSPEQQDEFNQKLVAAAHDAGNSRSLKGLGIAGGGLLAAKASGFGVYLLASSTLGALTTGLGLTLPFGAYMASSTALSWILGPVGFLGLGLLGFHKITGPNHQKMAIAIVAACAIRSRKQAEWSRRLRYFPWVIAAAIVCVLSILGFIRSRSTRLSVTAPVIAANSTTTPPRAPISSGTKTAYIEFRLGTALFRLIEPGAPETNVPAKLIIEQKGKPVYTDTSGRFTYSQALCGKSEWPNPGDLDGDGTAKVVIEDYSGGAHCCTTWRFFTVRDSTVLEYLKVENKDKDICPFEDLDGDGRPEVRVADTTFAHWGAYYNPSAMPSLTYRLHSGGITFAPALMRKPPPTDAELSAWAKEISWEGPTVETRPNPLAARLMAMLEAESAKSIPAFLDLAWPERVPGRAEYIRDFEKKLRSSEHWSEWNTLNGGISLEP
jgi:hypothetical protein